MPGEMLVSVPGRDRPLRPRHRVPADIRPEMLLTVSFQESEAGLENALLLWGNHFTYLFIFNPQCLLWRISDVKYTQCTVNGI